MEELEQELFAKLLSNSIVFKDDNPLLMTFGYAQLVVQRQGAYLVYEALKDFVADGLSVRKGDNVLLLPTGQIVIDDQRTTMK